MAKRKYVDGETITVLIPFSYQIGEEGPISGKAIRNITDAKEEVLLELETIDVSELNLYEDLNNTYGQL